MKYHKKKSEPKLEAPGNRPAGLPSNARFGAAVPVLILMLVSVNLVANFEVYMNNPEIYFRTGKIMFFPALIGIVGLGLMINSGKLVFVRTFKYVAYFFTILYFIDLILDFFQMLFYTTDRSIPVIIETAVLVLFSPMLYLMRRDFLRSRWLDPTSLPHEWEVAAIHDPNSINYRPPKSMRR